MKLGIYAALDTSTALVLVVGCARKREGVGVDFQRGGDWAAEETVKGEMIGLAREAGAGRSECAVGEEV